MSRLFTLTNHGQVPIRGAGNQDGLVPIRLDAFKNLPSFPHLGTLIVNSGQPWAQNWTDLAHEEPGKFQPIPEGHYKPGPLEFASGKWGDFSGRFPDVESPIWMVIHRLRAIGFHFDGNRAYAPGSAGCPVFRSLADCKTFYSWFGDDPFAFTDVWVDWDQVPGRMLPSGLVIPQK